MSSFVICYFLCFFFCIIFVFDSFVPDFRINIYPFKSDLLFDHKEEKDEEKKTQKLMTIKCNNDAQVIMNLF